MKRSRIGWRRTSAIAFGLVAALGLTACGGADGGSDESSDTLRVGVGVKILSVDPQGTQIGERTTLMVVQHVFDPLVRNIDGELEPALAESWDTSDPLAVTFTLREDVTFSDGTPVTSADVKASLERMFAASTPLSPLWVNVAGVEAPDEGTVTIRTSQPTGALLTNLSLVFIGSKAQIDSGAIETEPIGSGPFTLESFRSGESTVLTRNDSYWGDAPDLTTIEFLEIPEVSSRLTALQTGEIDVTYDIPPDSIEEVRGFDDITLETVPSLNNYFLWFNNARGPFTDERVREALTQAVDWAAIQESLFGEGATVAQAPVPQLAFGANPDLPAYEYDPEVAEDLLAQAGYPDGFSTTIQWSTECCANIRPLVQAVVSEWEKIGVTVELLEKERAQWLDDLLSLNWDINIQENAVITGDSEYVLGRLYTCVAERLGYCNPEYDAAIAAASAALDDAERESLLQDAQEILWNDNAAIFPLDLSANAAWRNAVQGFVPAPNNIPDFRNVSVG